MCIYGSIFGKMNKIHLNDEGRNVFFPLVFEVVITFHLKLDLESWQKSGMGGNNDCWLQLQVKNSHAGQQTDIRET